MSEILVLDCTLRDGGYINNFDFGAEVILDIFQKLIETRIDIVECGFLVDSEFDYNKTLFPSTEIFSKTMFFSEKNHNTLYVAMLALGKMS